MSRRLCGTPARRPAWALGAWLGLLGLLGTAHAQTPTVSTFEQLERLPLEQAREGRPATFTGVVLCYDREWGQLYVHDGTLTRYFSPGAFTNELEAGLAVRIAGQTAVIEGVRGLTNLSLTPLGRRELPTALRLELPQLTNGFGQWIETRGRVRAADNSRRRLGMTIHSEGQDCVVYVMGASANYDFRRLLDCEVRLRGINASKIVRGRLESAMVFVPSLAELQTVGPPAPDLSKLPVVSIEALLNRELGDWTNRLVHLNGLISAYRPGEYVVVRDPTGLIRAEVAQLTRARVDERVDLWGFLFVGAPEPLLKYAYFELIRPAEVAEAEGRAEAARPRSPPTGEVLTTVASIMAQPREKLAQHPPVLLRGVMTAADPGFRNGFFQDATDAIYVDLGQTNVQAGQWVELSGVADPGGFAPQVNEAVVRILAPTNLPAPVTLDLDDLADGRWDSHWVELRGVVRRIEVEWGRLYLTLSTRKGRFKAIVPGYGDKPPPAGWVDSLVSVPGACTSEVNAQGQLTGITLHTPRLELIRTLDAVPADPFAGPAQPIATVSTFESNRRAGHRQKIAGTVTLVQPGTGFYVQDESGGIRISLLSTNVPETDDRIEVLGFPSLGEFTPHLEEASWRRIGKAPPPEPKRTSAEEILQRGKFDGQRVELTAQLAQHVPRSAHPRLVLQDGAILFTAHLAASGETRLLQGLEPGSRLRLRGVCAVQGGEQQTPESFRLLLGAAAQDIHLLSTPGWWTASRALLAAEGLLVGVAAALAWVGSLRSRVRAQTEVIRQKLEERKQIEAALRESERQLRLIAENTADVIFAYDMNRRPVYANPALRELTGYTLAEIQQRPFRFWVHPDDQERLLGLWEELYAGKGHREVEFRLLSKAGDVKWCSGTWGPLFDESGRQIGVQGRERDISERKRLESELLEISSTERRRLGHELHDGLGQHLAGIALKAKLLEENLREEGSAEVARTHQVVALINAAIRQTRSLAQGLDPVHVEAGGLVPALSNLALQSRDLFHLDCSFVCPHERLDTNVETSLALYRIAQEAIRNAVVHGRANKVAVELGLHDTQLRLTVRDDGQGFVPASANSGMGLHIMRYRAGSIGGSLTIDSAPGKGALVTCRVNQNLRVARHDRSEPL